MKKYAQLNENNICVGVSDLSGVVSSPDMVDITGHQNPYGMLGMRYVEGVWEEIPAPEPEPEPHEPTNAEIAQLVMDLYTDLLIAGVIE